MTGPMSRFSLSFGKIKRGVVVPVNTVQICARAETMKLNGLRAKVLSTWHGTRLLASIGHGGVLTPGLDYISVRPVPDGFWQGREHQ